MIVFYPCKIEMWEPHFDFHPPITLTPKEKTDHKVFHDRAEFLLFLKEHGVQFNDPNNPVKFEFETKPCSYKGTLYNGVLYTVAQESHLGWIRDDFR